MLSLAAKYIVIGPVYLQRAGGWANVCLCVGVCYHNKLKIACIDLHQTGSAGEGSDHLKLAKFLPSLAPR